MSISSGARSNLDFQPERVFPKMLEKLMKISELLEKSQKINFIENHHLNASMWNRVTNYYIFGEFQGPCSTESQFMEEVSISENVEKSLKF